MALGTNTDASGAASLPLPVPNDPTMLGARFASQWAIADPAGAWLALASFSDALRIVVDR